MLYSIRKATVLSNYRNSIMWNAPCVVPNYGERSKLWKCLIGGIILQLPPDKGPSRVIYA